MAKFDPKDMKALNDLTKDQLVSFLCRKAVTAKKELEKKVFIEKHVSQTINTYDGYLKD